MQHICTAIASMTLDDSITFVMTRSNMPDPNEGDWFHVRNLLHTENSTQAQIFDAIRDELLRFASDDHVSSLMHPGAKKLLSLIEEVQRASHRAEGPLDQGAERSSQDVLWCKAYLENEEGFEQHRIEELVDFLRRAIDWNGPAGDLAESGADVLS